MYTPNTAKRCIEISHIVKSQPRSDRQGGRRPDAHDRGPSRFRICSGLPVGPRVKPWLSHSACLLTPNMAVPPIALHQFNEHVRMVASFPNPFPCARDIKLVFKTQLAGFRR
jgi:hypothetical protein